MLIGCRRRGARLRIDVYDTGIGIPHAKRRAVFKEFHRLDHGARVARGVGLGLSIVERIARVLEAEVTMKSVFGRGSRFSVEVPRAAAAAPAAEPARTARKSATGQLIGTVVVCIDNEPAILDGMQTLLGGWGCRVLTAENLAQAQVATGRTRRQRPRARRPVGRLSSRRRERRRRHQRIAPPLRPRSARRSSSPPTAPRMCAEEARACRRPHPQQAGQAGLAACSDHTVARAARRGRVGCHSGLATRGGCCRLGHLKVPFSREHPRSGARPPNDKKPAWQPLRSSARIPRG